jgi:hypothetical protein
MLDRESLLHLTGETESLEDVDRHLYRGVRKLGLQFAVGFGAAEAAQELTFLKQLATTSRPAWEELGHSRCVIYAPSAMGALSDHCSALHVRMWAPFDWRVEQYARGHVCSAAKARDEVKKLDRLQHDFARQLFGLNLDDLHRFGLAIDASLMDRDRIVETLLSAGGAVIAGPPQAPHAY